MLKLSQSILKKTHYIRHYTRQYIRLQEKKKREKKKKVKSKKKKTTKKDINVISKIISSAIVLSVKGGVSICCNGSEDYSFWLQNVLFEKYF